MTFKLVASVLAVSAATVLPAAAQEGSVTPQLGLPTTVSAQDAPSLPATNLLFVGGAFLGALGILAGTQGDSTTSTTSTTGTN